MFQEMMQRFDELHRRLVRLEQMTMYIAACQDDEILAYPHKTSALKYIKRNNWMYFPVDRSAQVYPPLCTAALIALSDAYHAAGIRGAAWLLECNDIQQIQYMTYPTHPKVSQIIDWVVEIATMRETNCNRTSDVGADIASGEVDYTATEEDGVTYWILSDGLRRQKYD